MLTVLFVGLEGVGVGELVLVVVFTLFDAALFASVWLGALDDVAAGVSVLCV